MKVNLGIWMDHRSANIMEFTNDSIESKVIESKFTTTEKEISTENRESLMNGQEQKQTEYYQQLLEVISNYKAVLLFGPTDAKIELLNLLRADNRFEKTDVDIKQADKMTENQKQAFVKEYFQNA